MNLSLIMETYLFDEIPAITEYKYENKINILLNYTYMSLF